MDIDKPPPYAPAYNDVNQYNQAPNPGGYPTSQGYNPGYPPAGGYQSPPQGGYQSPPQGGYQNPPPHQTVIHQHVPTTTAPQVIVVQQGPVATGNCPVCRQGNLYEEYSCCGICLAIFFFPIGLICCLLMKDKRCSHCGIRR